MPQVILQRCQKITRFCFFPLPGCKNKNHGALLKELMQTNNFRVTVVEEYDVVEICGALKVSFITNTAFYILHLNFHNSLLMLSFCNTKNCSAKFHKSPFSKHDICKTICSCLGKSQTKKTNALNNIPPLQTCQIQCKVSL